MSEADATIKCRSSYEERGLKYVDTVNDRIEYCRSSYEERGLKLFLL